MLKLPLALKSIVPASLDLPLRYAYQKLTGKLDFELTVLREGKPNCVRAIDVGANMGIYSYGLAQFCRFVEAFEPVVHSTEMLRAYAKKRQCISVHSVGLSNRTGHALLYIPTIEGSALPNVGLASINDPGGDREILAIPTTTLDEYCFSEVGILKIDVEGHEVEVLQGAVDTISRNGPHLLVEIEQRHLKDRRIQDVFSFVLSLGYVGGFYWNGIYHPLEHFSYELHQEPFLHDVYSKLYVNNFVFTPKGNLTK